MESIAAVSKAARGSVQGEHGSMRRRASRQGVAQPSYLGIDAVEPALQFDRYLLLRSPVPVVRGQNALPFCHVLGAYARM
jgi:hypothetical protein